jgi:hypothetical protein
MGSLTTPIGFLRFSLTGGGGRSPGSRELVQKFRIDRADWALDERMKLLHVGNILDYFNLMNA